MCGFAGFLAPDGLGDGAEQVAAAMADRVRHRGPDDQGTWVDAEAGVALAHRRLSVIDVSPAGHQPMLSHGGRFVLVFNGEIYNHLDLRARLGRRPWRGHSDTETLLACIEVWGLRGALEAAVGMFALALWDRQDRDLRLARDRMGEKPLYYGWQGGVFLFGSELKALEAHPAFQGEVDRGALGHYLERMYLAAPNCIYQGVSKLEPGRIAVVPSTEVGGSVRTEPYWSLSEVVERGRAEPFRGSFDDAVDELDRLLVESIRGQMVADVDLGAFLSGGIDSSTVVSVLQELADRPVRTFTIGFSEEAFDEAVHAKRVASHLGTEHTEVYVTAAQAMALAPALPDLYDEPFADSSALPTTLLSRLARRSVTVSLSGDGGDELFCGYERYQRALRHWPRLARVPRSVRSLVAGALPRRPGARTRVAAAALGARTHIELYDAMTRCWQPGEELVLGASSRNGRAPTDAPVPRGDWPLAEAMMYTDATGYLPGDILAKVDRAAMSCSLETRVPFLDHRIVEFSWTLPLAFKCGAGTQKRVVRGLLARRVPPTLTERPKMGFGVPLSEWLRGPLRPWVEDLLSEDRLRREGFLRPEPVRRAWEIHSSGSADLHDQLWTVLMFQAWLDRRTASVGSG